MNDKTTMLANAVKAAKKTGPYFTLFAVTSELERAARRKWGPASPGQTTAPWETGLDSIGLGNTRDVMNALAALA